VKSLRLLILGGTKFVGRHMTEAALARGHDVTLFNRGATNAELFPNASKIRGDRDGGLGALDDQTWDAVIDVNGYLPRLVRDSTERLETRAGRYVFISTLSVYADFSSDGQTEEAPLAQLSDPAVEEVNGDTYGGLKALCERAVESAFPDRNLILRLGYVVGPYDPTDRWTYYVRRVSQGGEMLVPGAPDQPIQFIDARDIAAFLLGLLEQRTRGIYNVTGPAAQLTWGEFLETARQVSSAETQFVWASEAFLDAREVPQDTFPLFAPGAARGIMTFDNRRALKAGLKFRPLAETIRDTLAWDRAAGTPQSGPDRAREAALLQALKSGGM
jgi:2'-hydroxyisoflavone reductase